MSWMQEVRSLTKCDKCPLGKKIKKNNINVYDECIHSNIENPETAKIIIVFHRYDSENRIKKFRKYLEQQHIDDYAIVFGLECSPHEFPKSVTQNTVYKHCNTFNIDKYKNARVILTVGSGLMSVTKNSDIMNWQEFQEQEFNQTYFYTGFESKRKVRVYPLPHIDLLMDMQSFEYSYFKNQITKIKRFLRTYEPYKIEDYEIIKVDDCNSFLKEYMDYDGYMAVDTETNNLNVFKDDFKVGCITLSFNGVQGYFLSLKDCNKRLLNKFFRDKKCITANGKYDSKALLMESISSISISEDITILYHLLNTDRRRNGLKSLAWLVGFGGYDTDLDEYVKKYKIKNYLNIPDSVLLDYSVLDAIVTYRLWKHAMDNLIPKQPEIYKLYQEIIIPVIDVFKDMEVEGIDVHVDYMNNFNRSLLNKEKELSDEICKELEVNPDSFNVASGEQLAVQLEEYGLPCLGRTKKEVYKTGVDELNEWIHKGYEIASKIKEFKKVNKMRTGFVGEINNPNNDDFNFGEETKPTKEEGYVKFIDSNNKLRYNFGVARTDAIRQSCSNCNIQQFSKDKELRKMLTFRDPFLWAEFDIAGFHMRLMAIQSKDKTMTKILNSDKDDLHSKTAQGVFCSNISFEEFLDKKSDGVYKNYRQQSKSINFNFLYGGSNFLLNPLVEQSWSQEQQDNYIQENNLELKEGYDGQPDIVSTITSDIKDKFMKTYSGIEPYIKKEIVFAEEHGYIDSPLGGRRHLPRMKFEYKGDNYKKELKHLHNICANTSILTFEAVYMQKAMVDIRKELIRRGMKSKMVLMIHDSIGFKIHKDEILELYDICMEIMQDFNSYSVPIKADCSLGDIWGFGKEVNRDDICFGIEKGMLIEYLKADVKVSIYKYYEVNYND